MQKSFYLKYLLILLSVITNQKEPLATSIRPLLQAINNGLEVGDIEYACHAADYYCSHLFFKGEYLDYVQERQKNYSDLTAKLSQDHQLYLIKIIGQLVANLMGLTDNKLLLIGDLLNEEETIAYLQSINNTIALFRVFFAKTMLCYLFQDYAMAIEHGITGVNYSKQ